MKLRVQDHTYDLLPADGKLLWEGRPDARQVFVSALFTYIIVIPWMLLSLYMLYVTGKPALSRLIEIDSVEKVGDMTLIVYIFGVMIGLLFVIFNIILFLSPFREYFDAKNTLYVITSKRIIIVTFGKYIKEQYYGLETLINEFEVKQRNDGSGSITFKRKQPEDNEESNEAKTKKRRNKIRRNIVFHIKDVRNVREIFMKAHEELVAALNKEQINS